MNKEERIEIINNMLRHCRKHPTQIENAFYENEEERRYEFANMLEVYKRFLQLPKRTIETLEVGDIVITTNQVGRLAFLIETETQRYIYSKNKDWFNITDIIPRESIELLKEILSE